MRNKKLRKLAYEEYLSSHFCKLHDLSKITDEYEKTYLFWRDYISCYLPKDSNANFLDLGCGLGHAMYALKKLGYLKVKGVDLSPECVEFCRKKGFNVEKTDITKVLENSNTEFEVIYAIDVLEHFNKEEALQLVKTVRSRLNKNGLFLLLIPNANNLSNFRIRYMDITHEVLYTPESIAQLLHCGGFKNIRIVGLRPFSLSDKSKRWALFKLILALPTYKLAEFFHKMFYLSMGITDVKTVSPRILVLAVTK